MCHDGHVPAQLISVSEVSRILDRPTRTVKEQAKRGVLPTVGKLPGLTGAYLFDRAAIEALAEAGAA